MMTFLTTIVGLFVVLSFGYILAQILLNKILNMFILFKNTYIYRKI